MPREFHGDGMEEAELASWGRQNWSSSTASAAGPGRAHPQGQPWGQGTVTAPGSFHCMDQCSFMGHLQFDQSPCGSDIRSSGHSPEGWVQTSSYPQCCQHRAGALGVAVLPLTCRVRVSSCPCRTRT